MPRGEFCPKDCLFASDENEGKGFKQMCDVDCRHAHDKKLTPFVIALKWFQGATREATVVAENGDDWYVEETMSNGQISRGSISKKSPLIK